MFPFSSGYPVAVATGQAKNVADTVGQSELASVRKKAKKKPL